MTPPVPPRVDMAAVERLLDARAEQGLPPRIADPAVIARIAAVLA